MSPQSSYEVERYKRAQKSRNRSIAFLARNGDPELDAKSTFEALPTEKQRLVRERFDYWLQGGVHDKYFHGWNDPDYRNCFVFKWKVNRQHQRLYGFLMHPCPNTTPRLAVCILVSHAQKNTENTDPAELNGAKELASIIEVVKAVKKAYPERQKGANRRDGNTLDRRQH